MIAHFSSSDLHAFNHTGFPVIWHAMHAADYKSILAPPTLLTMYSMYPTLHTVYSNITHYILQHYTLCTLCTPTLHTMYNITHYVPPSFLCGCKSKSPMFKQMLCKCVSVNHGWSIKPSKFCISSTCSKVLSTLKGCK